MGSSSTSPTWASCARKGKPCVGWVEKYFSDCVCSIKDDVSFGLGLVSLVLWAVAEIPQLITNFRTKSGYGVSLALLFTWVIGDVFNLVGCILEPATLPTQLYTALLYTAVTVILLVQTLYYDYFLKRWKCRRDINQTQDDDEEEGNKDWKSKRDDHYPSTPIPTSPLGMAPSIRRDTYYTSARSLASSGTPPYGSSASYLRTTGATTAVVKSGPAAALLQHHDSSSEDEETTSTTNHHPPSLPPQPPRGGRIRTISRSAGYGTFLAAAANLPSMTKGLLEGHVVLIGRKLLMETTSGSSTNTIGMWLGWIMAAIYMGGRLPQIFLNIKRGSVEGLNPLMFLFALMANATYVGSILVRSIEWIRIKANAPWLLDAVVCVLLDLFILAQFGYYKLKHRRTSHEDDDQEDYYVEAQKPQKPQS